MNKTNPITEAGERLQELMRGKSYSDDYVRQVKSKLFNLERFRTQNGIATTDSAKLFRKYLRHFTERYDRGEISPDHYRSTRTFVSRLESVMNTGNVDFDHKYVPHLDVPEYYHGLLAEIGKNHDWPHGTIRHVITAARMFFVWMRERGLRSCEELTNVIVKDYYMYKSSLAHRSSLFTIRFALKRLMEFLLDRGYMKCDCRGIFSMKIRGHRTLVPAMSDDEISKVLSAVDRTTVKGKRDYSIYVLGATMGLRGCDITALRLSDIDWRKGVVSIVQAKTAKPISQPLTAEAGEALKDYILNGRPEAATPYVFLRLKAPYRRINRNSLNKDFKAYFAKAGVEERPYDGKSFYSLRRAAGRRLVKAGVELPMIAQFLGHSTMLSVDRYITLTPEVLRECSLGLEGIEITK